MDDPESLPPPLLDGYDYADEQGPGFMHPLTQDILLTCILMAIIAIVGLVGNALMFRALIMYKTTRADFYILFGGLSIVDTAFLIISVPAHIMDMVEVEPSASWCKASQYLMAVFSLAGSIIIVALAVLRGIRLTNRSNLSQPQAKYVIGLLGIVYIVSFFSCIPVTNIYTSFKGILCDISHHSHPIRDVWLINSFLFFIPLGLIIVSYILTHMFGKRYFSDSYAPLEREKSRLVTAIVIAFVICQLPYRITTIVGKYRSKEASEESIRTINNYLMCLVMADKAIRPLLYSKLASDLSEAFDEVINCTYCYKRYYITETVDYPEHPVEIQDDPFMISNDFIVKDSELRESPSRSSYDRTTSSSSSASATSQTPLVKQTSSDSDLDPHIYSKNCPV